MTIIRPRLSIPCIGTAVALVLVVFAAVLVAGCTSQSDLPLSVTTPAPAPTFASTLPDGVTVTKIEVIHFHPARQCDSCITVGEYANATVTTYFADELASGMLIFRQIDGELEENREVVEQYGATGSSLWLGVYTSDGGFHPEENVRVWYRTDDQQRFMDYLKGMIEKRCAGDLSPV